MRKARILVLDDEHEQAEACHLVIQEPCDPRRIIPVDLEEKGKSLYETS